ncbi:MAG: cytochrome c [Chloroflexota bacterium]
MTFPARQRASILLLTLLALALSLAACGGSGPASGALYPIEPTAAQAEAGRVLYEANCIACHASPESGGERTLGAPAHDATGHTWHHADRLLAGWVLDGLPVQGSAMPAFRELLTEQEVVDILAYIKSAWPADVRAWQTEGSALYEEQLAE